MKIPEHIFWPMLVVALLTAGVISSASVVWFSQSDGGVQLVRSYEERGLVGEEPQTPSASEAPAENLSLDAGLQNDEPVDSESNDEADSTSGS